MAEANTLYPKRKARQLQNKVNFYKSDLKI